MLAHLGRLYDNTEGALSLPRFIETVRKNRALFSDEMFKERLRGNPHVIDLVSGRRIDDASLDAEVEKVSFRNPLVKELHYVRNNKIAHTDAEIVRKSVRNETHRGLSRSSVEDLLSRALSITRKYSLYFGASCYGGIAGAEDFENTLRLVREALSARRARI